MVPCVILAREIARARRRFWPSSELTCNHHAGSPGRSATLKMPPHAPLEIVCGVDHVVCLLKHPFAAGVKIAVSSDPVGTLRQLNHEVDQADGGAERGTWVMVLMVHGFETEAEARAFARQWRHPSATPAMARALRDKEVGSGRRAPGRVDLLLRLQQEEPWRSSPLVVILIGDVPWHREAAHDHPPAISHAVWQKLAAATSVRQLGKPRWFMTSSGEIIDYDARPAPPPLTFAHFDTLANVNVGVAQSVGAGLVPFLQESHGAIDFVLKPVVSQTNGYDCGVGMLAIAQFIIEAVRDAIEYGHAEHVIEATLQAKIASLGSEALTAKRCQWFEQLAEQRVGSRPVHASLAPGVWLDDDAVTAVLKHLEQSFCLPNVCKDDGEPPYSHPPLVVLYPAMAQLLLHDPAEAVADFALGDTASLRERLRSATVVIAAVNNASDAGGDGTHWSLLMACQNTFSSLHPNPNQLSSAVLSGTVEPSVASPSDTCSEAVGWKSPDEAEVNEDETGSADDDPFELMPFIARTAPSEVSAATLAASSGPVSTVTAHSSLFSGPPVASSPNPLPSDTVAAAELFKPDSLTAMDPERFVRNEYGTLLPCTHANVEALAHAADMHDHEHALACHKDMDGCRGGDNGHATDKSGIPDIHKDEMAPAPIAAPVGTTPAAGSTTPIKPLMVGDGFGGQLCVPLWPSCAKQAAGGSLVASNDTDESFLEESTSDQGAEDDTHAVSGGEDDDSTEEQGSDVFVYDGVRSSESDEANTSDDSFINDSVDSSDNPVETSASSDESFSEASGSGAGATDKEDGVAPHMLNTQQRKRLRGRRLRRLAKGRSEISVSDGSELSASSASTDGAARLATRPKVARRVLVSSGDEDDGVVDAHSPRPPTQYPSPASDASGRRASSATSDGASVRDTQPMVARRIHDSSGDENDEAHATQE